MKNKKSKKADLENKKGIFFLIGLVITLSMILFAFEWKTHPKAITTFGANSYNGWEDVYIPPTKPEEPKALPKKIEVPFLTLVDNESIVENDLEIFDSEADNETMIDFKNLIYTPTEEIIDTETEYFIFVDEMPEFPGGEVSLLSYLSSKTKYPAIAQENGVQGKVIVSFVINEDGSVSDAQIMRGIDTSLNNEALRVVRTLPKWKPGKQQGKAVKVRYNVPINFKLN